MSDTDTIERPGETEMPAAMTKATAAPARARRAASQPPYHSEICEQYLDEMQRRVDAEKPKDFKLTPISEPGW